MLQCSEEALRYKRALPKPPITPQGDATSPALAYALRAVDRAVDRALDRAVDRALDRALDRAVDRAVEHCPCCPRPYGHAAACYQARGAAVLTERSFNRMLIEHSFSVQCSILLRARRVGARGQARLLLPWPRVTKTF